MLIARGYVWLDLSLKFVHLLFQLGPQGPVILEAALTH